MPHAISPGDVLAGRFRLEDLLDESAGGRSGGPPTRPRPQRRRARPPRRRRRAPGCCSRGPHLRALVDRRLLRVLDATRPPTDRATARLCYVVNEWGTGVSLDMLLPRAARPAPGRLDGPGGGRDARGAHAAGVAHGRLLPENVMVTETGSVKLIGFASTPCCTGCPPGGCPSPTYQPRRPAVRRAGRPLAGHRGSTRPGGPAGATAGCCARARSAPACRASLDAICDAVLNADAAHPGRTHAAPTTAHARGSAPRCATSSGTGRRWPTPRRPPPAARGRPASRDRPRWRCLPAAPPAAGVAAPPPAARGSTWTTRPERARPSRPRRRARRRAGARAEPADAEPAEPHAATPPTPRAHRRRAAPPPDRPTGRPRPDPALRRRRRRRPASPSGPSSRRPRRRSTTSPSGRCSRPTPSTAARSADPGAGRRQGARRPPDGHGPWDTSTGTGRRRPDRSGIAEPVDGRRGRRCRAAAGCGSPDGRRRWRWCCSPWSSPSTSAAADRRRARARARTPSTAHADRAAGGQPTASTRRSTTSTPRATRRRRTPSGALAIDGDPATAWQTQDLRASSSSPAG